MRWLYLAALALLLQACGGGDGATSGGGAPQEVCSVADQRALLNRFMGQEYYWYAQMGTPDANAESPDAYFQSLLYKPVDRFSFSEPTASHNQLFVEGRRVGFGYSLVWTDATHATMRVRNVEPLSPVAHAGLARGDTVLSIDGFSPAEVAAGVLPLVNTPGVIRSFYVRKLSGELRSITVRSEDFALSPVAGTATFDVVRNGAPVKVAYLAYHQFVGYSEPQLEQAFAQFRDQGAREIVLDLRYNGGGSVNVSRDLAGMIGGPRTAGQTYTWLQYNDRLPFNKFPIAFSEQAASGFDRVIVIGSGATASASELLINGLRPFMDVVLLGETTYGKPFGFSPRNFCGITYNAVEFETTNALGVGGYTSGFTPDCPVADDLDHELADPAERRLHAALDYVATGSCGPQPQALAAGRPKSPAEVFGETAPSQMFVQ